MNNILKVYQEIANLTEDDLRKFESSIRDRMDWKALNVLRNLRRVRNSIKENYELNEIQTIS